MKKPPEKIPPLLRRLVRNWQNRRRRYTLWLMEDVGVAYLPVPKAASSSIRAAMRERMGPRMFADDWSDSRGGRSRVEAEIRRSVGPRALVARRQELFIFTFVRNPLTRLYSCYRDKVVNAEQRREECTLSPYGIHFGCSFDDFVRQVAEIPDVQSDQHFRSQHNFVTHGDVLLVDHVGRVENLADDWSAIEHRCGLSCPAPTKRVSGAPVAAEALPLSRDVAELAVRRYQRDIELFGYEAEIRAILARLP